MMGDDATQFSYFGDNELTQLAASEISSSDPSQEKDVALKEGTIFLNKYKILKVLGEGSFSLIYLLEAVDASKKLLVAKEFFPKGYVTRSESNEVILKTSLSKKEIENYQFMKEIFIGEAQNLVKVSLRAHPNVLNFFSLEENVNNTMYLITDYEEGITLKEYLKQRKEEYKGKLSNDELINLLQGILSGLEHIHAANVYHQDIKLENILIRPDHTPLLLDFGASAILYDKKRKKYFNATTPRYAAPEQVELSQPPAIDQRTDIYGLGVLAYKLVTDTFPPSARERLKALDEEYDDPYIPLAVQKIYGYDKNLLKSIDKALELSPVNRFQSATEFRNELSKKRLPKLSILKILLGVILPLVGVLIYFVWPTAKGIAKLNLKEKTFLVYDDGVRVPVSDEKTILLPVGKHRLTFIKDGYAPMEMNVTIEEKKITNIDTKLIPLMHKIELISNVKDAKFIVNNKVISGNSFEGEYGGNYTIKTIALNHPTEIAKTNYTELFQKGFQFYQHVKSKIQTVTVKVNKLFDTGKTIIKVNNNPIKQNRFDAADSKKYNIDIYDPYFKPFHIEKDYEDLIKSPIQEFTLEPGEGEIVLHGLPAETNIAAYQKNKKQNRKMSIKLKYNNGDYYIRTGATDKIYLLFSKSGFASKTTPVFSLEHNETIHQTYKLDKINPISRGNASKISNQINNVTSSQDAAKSKIKQVNKIRKSKKSTRKQKKSKQTSVSTIAKKKTINRLKTIKNRKRKQTPKRKVVKKRNMSPVDHLWYCVATNRKGKIWSAKQNSRQKAYNMALSRCNKHSKSVCYISSCYLWAQ